MKTSKIVAELIAALTFASICQAAAVPVSSEWNQSDLKGGVTIADLGAGAAAQAPCSPNGVFWFGDGKGASVDLENPASFEFGTTNSSNPLYTQLMMMNEPLYPPPEAPTAGEKLRIFVREGEPNNSLIVQFGTNPGEPIDLEGLEPNEWFTVTVKNTPGVGYNVKVWQKVGATFETVGATSVSATSASIGATTTIGISGAGAFANILASYGDPDRTPLVYVAPPAVAGGESEASLDARQYVVDQLLELGVVGSDGATPAVTGTTKIMGADQTINSHAAIDAAYLLGASLAEEDEAVTFNYQLGLCHFKRIGETLEACVRLELSGTVPASHTINGTIRIQGSQTGIDGWTTIPGLNISPIFRNGESGIVSWNWAAGGYKFYRAIVE